MPTEPMTDRSTLVPWPKPWPPAPSFIRCPDCDSQPDAMGSKDLTELYLYVIHSETCPNWASAEPELAIELRSC